MCHLLACFFTYIRFMRMFVGAGKVRFHPALPPLCMCYIFSVFFDTQGATDSTHMRWPTKTLWVLCETYLFAILLQCFHLAL